MYPGHQPTEETRAKVYNWAKYGVPVEDMAVMIGLATKTVQKHYATEIAAGKSFAHTTVRQTLWDMATSGEHPAMTIFYCKTQLGFREVDRSNITDGQITLHVKGGLPD
jgi:predicted transcriptional regulator